MRTIGLIGGMSAESTVVYYQTLNRLARERLGGIHSAELVIRSVDFAPVAALQSADASYASLTRATGGMVARMEALTTAELEESTRRSSRNSLLLGLVALGAAAGAPAGSKPDFEAYRASTT